MNEAEINFPAHYTRGKIEPREVVEDWDLGFNLGNVLKYLARYRYKNRPVEDLKKARKYLEFEIEKLERRESADGKV